MVATIVRPKSEVSLRYQFGKRPQSPSIGDNYGQERCTFKAILSDGNQTTEVIPDSQNKGMKILTINDLTDDCLLSIFVQLHPIDLIHCVSYVCQRWNYLSKKPSLYSKIRVIISPNSLRHGATKKFLQRVRYAVKKLCIEYRYWNVPPNEIDFWQVVYEDMKRQEPDYFPYLAAQNALPDCMPNVVHLEIHADGLTTEMYRKVIECFPNVVTLKFSYIKMNTKNRIIAVGDKDLDFFQDEAFPHLKNLNLGMKSGGDLWKWKRPIETLSLVYPESLGRFSPSSDNSRITELTILFTKVTDICFLEICQMRNLEFLKIGFLCIEDNQVLNQLKNLSKLEYFCLGRQSKLDIQNFISVLLLPNEDPQLYFPYNLKHLLLMSPLANQNMLETISKSCSKLESLSLYLENSSGSDEKMFLTAVTTMFRKLRYIRLDFTDQPNDDIWKYFVNGSLPELQILLLRRVKINVRENAFNSSVSSNIATNFCGARFGVLISVAANDSSNDIFTFSMQQNNKTILRTFNEADCPRLFGDQFRDLLDVLCVGSAD